jgi:hypothetical protein
VAGFTPGPAYTRLVALWTIRCSICGQRFAIPPEEAAVLESLPPEKQSGFSPLVPNHEKPGRPYAEEWCDGSLRGGQIEREDDGYDPGETSG